MEPKNFWDGFFARMQAIDPRYLYVAVLLFIIVPLLVGVTIPGIPSTPAVKAYDTVERVAKERPNDLVVISSDWSNSTRGESHWQSLAILRQLMGHHLKFALVSFDAQNRSLMQADISTMDNELAATPGYRRYVYGKDYCLWGYKPSTAIPQFLQGLVQNVPGTVKADYRGTPVSQLPVMSGVETINNISLIVLLTPSNTLDNWLQFVVRGGQPPLVYFPTSVMAPEGYPYLDSGQISGMVSGIKGAGDYEQLEHVKGFGQTISTALSLVYILILLLILIGNIGYYAGRQRRRRGTAA